MNKDLIAELLSAGIRVPDSITGRKGGAGPAEGRAFLLNGLAVNIPIAAAYVADSPFELRLQGDGYILLKNGTEMGPIGIVPEPHFYQGQTADGTDYAQIALLHGQDCLATTVNQRCVHWQTGQKCKFCGTEISLNSGRTIATKRPAQGCVFVFLKSSQYVSHSLKNINSNFINHFIDYLLSARSEIIDLLNTYTIESVYCTDLI